MQIKTNPKGDASEPMRLDAEALKLNSISIDGKPMASSDYEWDGDDVLVLKGPLPAEFTLETDVTIRPQDNTQLSGLYKSGMYCTQCEAEGFRRITPFQDRPDVMASYKVIYPNPGSNRALHCRREGSYIFLCRLRTCSHVSQHPSGCSQNPQPYPGPKKLHSVDRSKSSLYCRSRAVPIPLHPQ